MTTEKTFSEIEYEAWSQRADLYEALFTQISNQAIGPILDSLEPMERKRHLDAACGPGHLVAAASWRGAVSKGIDFSPTMVNAAKTNYPWGRFQVADATDLPHKDGSFDAVSCAFGLHHMEDPLAAMREAFRVLNPGGLYAFTLWHGPEGGNQPARITQDAVRRFLVNPYVLPEQWVQLRYADEQACTAFTQKAGFNPPVFQKIPIVWRTKSAQDVVDVMVKLSIRTRKVIDHQPPAVQQQIIECIRRAAEDQHVEGVITLAWPAMLALVQKPE